MNALVNVLIRVLMLTFEMGVAGCVLLIPVVAFKFMAVLFEKDLVDETPSVQG